MKNQTRGAVLEKKSSLSYAAMRKQIMEILATPVEFTDDQNLIELGLNSLQMMRMVSKWRKSGAKVTFAELIANPCLGEWWSLLEKNAAVASASPAPDQKEALPAAEEKGETVFSLTDVQYAYWVGRRDEQTLGGIGCHAYLELDGHRVLPQRLESAWQKLLSYHAMLRARFLESGHQEIMAEPYQQSIVVHDLRLLDANETKQQLQEIRERLSHRRLRVEEGEVAGLELSLLPGGDARIHFDIDLLVADVQSLHIILRDLAAAYARDCDPATPRNWSFTQYLKKEEQRRSCERETAGRYWQERLLTLPTAPELPLQQAPEAIKKPVFQRRTALIKAEDWQRFQKYAAYYQVTPAMVLLTAYGEALDRWSTNSKFLINIPLFDRQTGEPELEDVVADFTNLLLLEVDYSEPQAFIDRIRSVQDQFYQDVAHAAYSGIQLQRDLLRLRPTEKALAPVVFACNLGTFLINNECRETLGNLSYMISQTPQVWLDFQTYETDQGLLLAWDAVEELFPSGLIEQMFEAYVGFMNQLATEQNSWQTIPDLYLVTKQRRMQYNFLETVPPVKRSLHTAFFNYAAKKPEATAVIDSGTNTVLTYGQLAEAALKVAAFLQEQGVQPETAVAVTLPRGSAQIVAVLGILAMGGCYVPVSISQPLARRKLIHQKAALSYVLTDSSSSTKISWPTETVVLDIATAEKRTPLASPVAVDPETLSYIIFTSGSTGDPKGVALNHYAAWNTIAAINQQYQVSAADSILAVSALDFDLSVYDLFGLLSVGGSLVLLTEATRRDAVQWLRLLQKYQITLWNSVPILLEMLLVVAESNKEKKLALRLAMLSGDWIGLDLPPRLQNVCADCHLVAMGGATEAAIWSNYFEVTLPLPEHWTSIPYGRPLPNQAYRVVDTQGRDCPDWVAGELWIGGMGVAREYRGDSELTAARFVSWQGSRWYRTGDLGRYWPDGNIEFLGRQDFQVKIRGHRIELGEIEVALKQYPDIKEAVVIVEGEPRGNKQLVGYLVPQQKSTLSFIAEERGDTQKINNLWHNLLVVGSEEGRTALPEAIKPSYFPLFWWYLEELSLHFIWQMLEKIGVFQKQGEKYYIETLLSEYGIVTRYRELIMDWLEILVKEGFLKKDQEESYTRMRILPPGRFEDFKEMSYFWEGDHSAQESLLNYLKQIANYSTAFLKGELNPLEVFFSEEGSLSPTHLMQLLPGTNYRNHLFKKVFQVVVQQSAEPQPLRLLEIGCRSLPLTEELLTMLPASGVSYTCTDNSHFFTNGAKNKLADYPFIEYRLFDIERNPWEQGYTAHSYEVIIAVNSLHRTRNINTALEYLQSLLAPGGLLVLLEMTRNSRLQKISTGFLEEGFRHFQDERQETHTPLFSAKKWKKILQAQKFEAVRVFPEESESFGIYGQHLIVAQAPAQVKRFNPAKLVEFLEGKIPDYMIPTSWMLLPQLPLNANGKLDRKSLPKVVNLSEVKTEKMIKRPTTKPEILLAKVWRQILNLEEISITDNFFQLGGDSLLATKVSTMVREQMGILLPLGSIFESPTIAELAKTLQVLSEKAGETVAVALTLPQIKPHPEESQQPFPLTDIQQAYWVGRSGIYALGKVSTHCYFEIEGVALDLEGLNQSWQRLIAHHEMMRAVVLADGQQQKIFKEVPLYQIQTQDLRNMSKAETRAHLVAIREEMSHQVLDSHQWPVFDVRASLFGEKRVRLHISFDNLFFDGWSMFHLLKEWTRLYHHPEEELPPLELSFRDYVLALKDLTASDLYRQAQAYWFERLADLPPAPELPLAQSPEAITEQRFGRLEASLNRETWQQLKQKAAESGITPSGLLLTAYAEVLGVWSKQPRLTINLTQFNRLPLHPQVQKIVGDFTSLTLLAVDNAAGKTFMERGRNLQQQLWNDLDHSLVSGVQVQRELAKRSGQQQGVEMPVVFTSALGVDQWNEAGTGQKWLGKLIYNITQTPQVWLDHQVVEQDEELLLIWDFVVGLFPEGMLDDMFTAYRHLLQRLADETTIWAERAAQLVVVPRLSARRTANQTAAPVSGARLTDLFMNQMVSEPLAAPAVLSPKGSLTYAELHHRSHEVAVLLRKKGAKPNTLVAVVMKKGWEQVVAVLGILKSGAAYLPLDPHNPQERLWQLLENAEVNIVLTQAEVEQKLSWPKTVDRVLVDRLRPAAPGFTPLELVGEPENLAYVIYTSGSTGFPKGVMIDHRGAVNTILDINQRFSVGPQDRVLALSNLNFDLSVYDIFGMLTAGAGIVMPNPDQTKDPAHWLELMKQEQVTVWNTVPTLMQMLIEYVSARDEELPQSLRLVLLSGDWIPLELPDQVKAHFSKAEVIGLGGATEASIWSNYYAIGEIEKSWKSIPYGRPLVNQQYHILNESGGDCPVWVPGQLYISGLGLAKGYWKDEAKTKERFPAHPSTGERLYATGDLGRYLPDGNIEFLGREDFQVKIRGHRIELGEIEAALKQQRGVKDAVVLVSEAKEKQLLAYVVPEPEQGGDFLEIKQKDPELCAGELESIKQVGQLQSRQLLTTFACQDLSIYMEYTEGLSLKYICQTFAQLGLFTQVGERYSLESLMERFQIEARYQILIRHWLQVLTDEGMLVKNDQDFYISSVALNEGLIDKNLSELLARLTCHLKIEAEALAGFFQRDSWLYQDLLRGEMDPLALYLKEDSFLTPRVLSRFNLTKDYYLQLSQAVCKEIFDNFSPDQDVRVLEIGTRVGSLTKSLVALLPEEQGHYLYVDESAFFTDQVKQKLGENNRLEFGLFDMNKNPFQQGYEAHSFQVIIADNTLHRSRNLTKTLVYLRKLLAPGGLLLFVESTRNRRLMLTTVAFFEDGFRQLEDERQKDYLPLISAEEWQVALAKSGFLESCYFPEAGSPAEVLGEHLIVAQAPGAVAVFNSEKLAAVMSEKLPEYMVPAKHLVMETLPLSANGKIDRKALAELSRDQQIATKKETIAPVTLLQTKLTNIWQDLLGTQQFGINNSFFELGGDSLRGIQCVNLIKEEFAVEISLQEFFEATHIESLAQLIETKAAATQPVAEAYEVGLI